MFCVLLPVAKGTDPNEVVLCIKKIREDVGDAMKIIVILNPATEKGTLKDLLNWDSHTIIETCCFKQISFALNHAINKHPHDYYIRMDVDDVWLKGRIARLRYSASKGVDVIFGSAIIGRSLTIANERWVSKLWFKNSIVHPAVTFSRRFILKANGYSAPSAGQDYELWLRTVGSRRFMSGANIRAVYDSEPHIEYIVKKSSTTHISKTNTHFLEIGWKFKAFIKDGRILMLLGSLVSLLKGCLNAIIR